MKFNKPLLLIIVALFLIVSNYLDKEKTENAPPSQNSTIQKQQGEDLAAAIKNHADKVWVEGSGTVVALLPDDTQGSRHQKILITVKGAKKTVLIAHNIDLAPRVDGLHKGDSIRFFGEYIWNEKGGVLHWTHRDPGGHKAGGWIEAGGKRYN